MKFFILDERVEILRKDHCVGIVQPDKNKFNIIILPGYKEDQQCRRHFV